MNGLDLNIGGETIALALVIIAIVEKLKVWLKTEGFWNTLLSLGVGTALGALIYLAGQLGWQVTSEPMTIVQLLIQGFISGFVAAGGFKLIFGAKKLT